MRYQAFPAPRLREEGKGEGFVHSRTRGLRRVQSVGPPLPDPLLQRRRGSSTEVELNPRTFTLVVLAVSAWPASAAEPAATNAPPPQMLLLDQLGRLVGVPTNAVHRSLLPPRDIGLKQPDPESSRRHRRAGRSLAATERIP